VVFGGGAAARHAAEAEPPQEIEDFEQELVDQYLLASVGVGDHTVGQDRAVIFEFIAFVGRPVDGPAARCGSVPCLPAQGKEPGTFDGTA
jgi:hypothetical protein